MNKKAYLIGLLSTMSLFAAFVYFILDPKFGPQIVYNNPQEQNNEDQQESSDTQDTSNQAGLNPDYSDLTENQIQIADKAIGDLLNSSEGITPPMIAVKSFEEQEFNDASMGCGKEGESYAQVITPGYSILLEAQGQEYNYRVSAEGDIVLRCN